MYFSASANFLICVREGRAAISHYSLLAFAIYTQQIHSATAIEVGVSLLVHVRR